MRACAAAVASRAVSVSEIARVTLERIERVDPELQAFTFLDAEAILAEASRLDAKVARRRHSTGRLLGVPLGVKDLFDVRGFPTSYGARAFEPHLPAADAAAVGRLRDADALIVGKTRTAELAWSTDTPPTKNPRDSRLIPGGSSGGSGAAVGASLVHAALGTDTGGSVRIPAALCGVVGLKPTYGAVGRTGVLPASWSLDTVGPLARSVDDVRVVLAALVAHDPGDPASTAPATVEPLEESLAWPAPLTLRGLRLGVLTEPLFEIVEDRARSAHERLLQLLADEGVQLVTLDFPEAEFVPAALIAIDFAESAAVHTERLRDRPAEIDDGIRALLNVAHAIPGALVARAHQVRRAITQRMATLFRTWELDALVLPANAAPAIRRDELDTVFQRATGSRELALWSYPRVFWLASLTGQPAVVIPTVPEPPPLAVQLVGRPFEDGRVLDLAAALEELLPVDAVPSG